MKGKTRIFRLLAIASITMVAMLVSGCLYPKERLVENQVPSTFYLEAAQKAVEQFQAAEGVLPIVTKPADTPIFEKYEIDFRRLIPRYLPDIPANAFEKGGVYQYVLIDAETKPQVKLLDLGLVSRVADVQQAVNRYRNNRGRLPVKQTLENGYAAIDFDAIGMKEPVVKSPFTDQLLSMVMNEKGEVGIDYAPDIAAVLRNTKAKVPPNTDPRYVLARESMYVPVKSFPYELKNGEPHFLKF